MARKAYVPTRAEKASIVKWLLMGQSMREIKSGFASDSAVTVASIRRIREDLFSGLRDNPGKVKKLANGEVLNACEVIKYRDTSRRATPKIEQLSILDICDGAMNS